MVLIRKELNTLSVLVAFRSSHQEMFCKEKCSGNHKLAKYIWKNSLLIFLQIVGLHPF